MLTLLRNHGEFMAIKVGLIGFGYWGPNLARNITGQIQMELKTICDGTPGALERAKKLFPWVSLESHSQALLTDKNIDAIVIATPLSTHYDLAKKALLAGKHVLIEKPICQTTSEAVELVELARTASKTLMVDHTFLYTPAIVKTRQLIDDGTLGTIQYYDSTRISLGLLQQDTNVIWDLGVHDIYIILSLIKERPTTVCATGVRFAGHQHESMAYITLNYAKDIIAHISCSWNSPVKLRRILIGGTKKMLAFDDMEPSEKLKLYDTCIVVDPNLHSARLKVDYRVGDIMIPKVDLREGLAGMIAEFATCISTGKTPLSDGNHATAVMRVLEAAQQSIDNRGRETPISF